MIYLNTDLLIVSSRIDDLSPIIKHIEYFQNNLFAYFKNIVLVTPRISDEYRGKLKGLKFINDDDFLNIDLSLKIKALFLKRKVKPRRIGWYRQQLIKLLYSKITSSPYYLVWDADTVPLNKITFFDEKYPTYNVGRKWRDKYFDEGLSRALGQKRISESTYITEYMIFNSMHVTALLNEFGSDISGQIKMLMNLTMGDYENDCFSEFELYGSFLEKYGYLNSYRPIKLHSIRNLNNLLPWRRDDKKCKLLMQHGCHYGSFENSHKSRKYRLRWLLYSLYLEINYFLVGDKVL
jgi:hypothetical protein